MTFDEWWEQNNCSDNDPPYLVAEHCWKQQRAYIDELEKHNTQLAADLNNRTKQLHELSETIFMLQECLEQEGKK